MKESKEVKEFREQVRTALSGYIQSEGCSCCRNIEEHKKYEEILGKLLRVEKYKDGSGYDFYKYNQ